MSRTVYVNGEYLPEEDAKISIFDRGFLFADAIYEVCSVIDGRLIDFEGHFQRLERSSGELDLNLPASRDEILEIHRELVRLNGIQEGLVYMQISRGSADRDFVFPKDSKPTIVLFTQQIPLQEMIDRPKGIRVISIDDLRWARRDIKTVQLLYPSMCKMMAKKAGADDAWLIQDGCVTEGTSNNAYIVTKSGTIVTRQLSNDILHGVTRAAVLRLAREAQMQVEERPFTIEEAQNASEAFITSATNFATSVVSVDGIAIGSGKPGPVTARLREIYAEECRRQAI
ncbi:MAG: D-amino-acid transaminase [Albidovulum sp.]|nr:D-amino-acid transaminase [Albidovulum sp.]